MNLSEFNSAVGAARVGATGKASNAFPDAAAGANGGFPAGETQEAPAGSEFSAAVALSRPDACGCAAYSRADAPDGSNGFVRGDQDMFSYSPSGETLMAAGNTCAPMTGATKSYPDAAGGAAGKASADVK